MSSVSEAISRAAATSIVWLSSLLPIYGQVAEHSVYNTQPLTPCHARGMPQCSSEWSGPNSIFGKLYQYALTHLSKLKHEDVEVPPRVLVPGSTQHAGYVDNFMVVGVREAQSGNVVRKSTLT